MVDKVSDRSGAHVFPGAHYGYGCFSPVYPNSPEDAGIQFEAWVPGASRPGSVCLGGLGSQAITMATQQGSQGREPNLELLKT